MLPLAIHKSPHAIETPFDNSTNGFTANTVQAAIEESSHLLTSGEAADAATDTTTSGTDALLDNMTTGNLPAGTYLIWFSTSITTSVAGSAVSCSYYKGGTQEPTTVMKHSVFDGGALSATSGRGAISINKKLVLNGSQAVEVRWSVSSGTATCGPRVLNWLRVG